MPLLRQIVDALRKDDHNPIHALDPWLLRGIEKAPPSTLQELAPRLLQGPGRNDPELTLRQVFRWMRDASERWLIEARTVDPAGPPAWVVTEAGRERLRSLGGIRNQLGNALGWITRTPTTWVGAVARLAEQEEIRTGEPPPKRSGLPRITRCRTDRDALTPEAARENLEKVEHIIVLMMENRSFDHMLGYLDLVDGQNEVRGLKGARPIAHEGQVHHPQYLLNTRFPKSMDPPHGGEEIGKQINEGAMDGFIESFARSNDVPNPEQVMGYYTHRELPVYDYFAHNFLLCDQWFSSVPSATWPNRLYALTGTCQPPREGLFDGNERFYDLQSFVRLLRDNERHDTWRWYSWDPGSLRLVDGRYRANAGERFHHDHFRRVAQHSIEPVELRDDKLALGSGLLEDAANGDLPRVAWIDPNFVDLSILEANSNDDHPPSDVRAGQELVMLVFRALAESPRWDKTMLVVTYDEHGGFYDHEPPGVPPEHDPQFRTYGVRVPAFIVSPLVEPCTVSHTTFDHTSITRTILERFGVEGAVEQMAETAPRVGKTSHLGRLLARDPAGDLAAPDYANVNAMLDNWRHSRAHRRSAASPELAARAASEEVWKPPSIEGFPAEFMDAARALRADGLPAGHP